MIDQQGATLRKRNRITIDFKWVAPIIIIGVGALFPQLRNPVEVGWPVEISQDVYGPLLVQALAAAAWLFYELVYSASRETSIRMLQVDSLIGLVWSVVISMLAVYLWCNDLLLWCVIPGWIAALIDGAFSPFLAINNAGQKPFGLHGQT